MPSQNFDENDIVYTLIEGLNDEDHVVMYRPIQLPGYPNPTSTLRRLCGNSAGTLRGCLIYNKYLLGELVAGAVPFDLG